MAPDDNNQTGESRIGTASVVVGLVVFAVGIVMVVLVFSWAYAIVESIDEQMLQVHYVPGLTVGTTVNTEAHVAAAEPGGPGIGPVAAAISLRLLGLLVLGWLGAMVAGKGAEMTGVRLRLQR